MLITEQIENRQKTDTQQQDQQHILRDDPPCLTACSNECPK